MESTLQNLKPKDIFISKTELTIRVYVTGGGTYLKKIPANTTFSVKAKTIRSLEVVYEELKGIKKMNYSDNKNVTVILKSYAQLKKK